MMTRWTNRPLSRKLWRVGYNQFHHLQTHRFQDSHPHNRLHRLRQGGSRLHPMGRRLPHRVQPLHHQEVLEAQEVLGVLEAMEVPGAMGEVGFAASRREVSNPMGRRRPLYLKAEDPRQVGMQGLARFLSWGSL